MANWKTLPDKRADSFKRAAAGIKVPGTFAARGDANVVYRFAQSPQLQMRTGVGLNWLSDDSGCDFGFNFTYGGDFFPVDPWILSAEIDWGRLGHAGLFHGRATVGVHFHRVEIYTGYDYLDVGRSQINSLVSGVRVWY